MKIGGNYFEITGDTQAELFKEMAAAHEVFGVTECKLCKGPIKPVVRTNNEGDDFFEYHCLKCFARLALGQNKKGGGLFPIRKLTKEGKPDRTTGSFGNHDGWTQYRGEPKPESEQQATSVARR